MMHPTEHQGADAVIHSEITEAAERRDQYEIFAAVLRVPLVAVVLGLAVLIGGAVFDWPPRWGALGIGASVAALTGWSRHRSLQRAEAYDLIVAERRAALSEPRDV